MNVTVAGDPVFVVGMNGSGTTMLLDCLGRHPALYAFPRETRLIPYLMARLPGYGDLGRDDNLARLYDDVGGLDVFREVNDGRSVPRPADWRVRPRTLAAVLDATFEHFAAREGKRRWCEKTPQHVQHLEALADQFPDARFVHVVRDGRDCAVSFHRRWRRQPELTIYRWKKVVQRGHVQGIRLGASRYLEIPYEELTAEPERCLRRICAFLELPFRECVLESSQPYLQGSAARRGLRPNSGKWLRYFPPETLDRLERIAGRTLAQCGYPTRHPLSDHDPTPLQRRRWAVAEVWRQYSSEVRRKLNGELERPWRAILVKPINALRQRQHNVY